MLSATTTPKRKRTSSRYLVRKNMVMDQRKLDAAKKYLGAATETETIDKALDLITFRDEVISGLEAAADLGPITELYRRR